MAREPEPLRPATPGARVQHALAGLELALVRHRRAARARLGVSDEELTTLAYLAFAGPTAQPRVVQLSALSRGGVDALLARLEQLGLLARSVDRDDRRRRLVALTERGRAEVARAFRGRDEAALRAVVGQGPAVVDALAQLVAELTEAAEAAGEEPGRVVGSASGGPIWARWA